VGYRVGEILELTDISNWHWVPTKENPADDATQDVTSDDLSSKSRWLLGPKFLKHDPDLWPLEKKSELSDEGELELRSDVVLQIDERKCVHLPEITRFSSWKKLIRTTAWINRFIMNCKGPIRKSGP